MKRPIVILAASACLFGGALAKSPPAPDQHQVGSGHKPRIACDKSGNLHVVYEGLPNSYRLTDVFYSKSTDGGATWSKGLDIARTPGASSDPDISVESNGAIDVAWKDTSPGEQSPDIFFSRSADGGKTWTYAADVSNTAGASTEPAISCGPDDSIHVVWVDTSASPTNPDIYHSVSGNAGETWSKPENISNTPGISREPDVSVGSDGTVHAAWSDTTSGPTHPDIYYSRLPVSGTWTAPADISHSARVSAHPCLATGPKGRVYLGWQDNSKRENAADIWCAFAGKKATWTKPLNISNTPGVSSEPCIAADDAGRIAIAWSDNTTGTTRPDICARISLNSASDFSNQMNVSNTTVKSKHPDATLIGSKVYVVWEEIGGPNSMVKMMCMELKGIPTGPAEEVEPAITGRTM